MSLTLPWLINWGVASSFLANLATLLIIFRIRSCNGSYKTPRVSRQQATTFRCTTHALIPRWGIWRLPNVCLSYGREIWLQRLNGGLRNTSVPRNTRSSNFSSIHLQPSSSFGLVARKKIRHCSTQQNSSLPTKTWAKTAFAEGNTSLKLATCDLALCNKYPLYREKSFFITLYIIKMSKQCLKH